MGKTALLILAAGAEEMEAVIAADVLRRGGVDVTVAGLDGADAVVCSRKVRVLPDCALADVKDKQFDAVVLPGGGPGAKALAASPVVKAVLSGQAARDGLIAAICAAPTALKAHGIAKGRKVTSYPAFKDELAADYAYQEDAVVVDQNLVTSRGPGTAFAFAVELVKILQGEEEAKKLPPAMLL